MSPTPQRSSGDAPLLVVVPVVGMAVEGERVFMDIKATEGLALYAKLWPGRVLCLSRAALPGSFGYGQWYDRADLPFAVDCVPADATAATIAAHARGAAIILAGADDHRALDLATEAAPVPVVYTIEYTLKTRLDILRLTRQARWPAIKSGIWLRLIEPRRRAAIRRAAGIQANGTPAFASYRKGNADPILYFDTRLKERLFIGGEAAERKAAAILERGPLRLAFSGRLERIKGADYLVPVVAELHRLGMRDATLDVFGDGTLASSIAAQAEAAGLADAVRLHGPVPYETELVPRLQHDVDLFLCCHPQADPSCTYLETLGCGVPIAGFLNDAFAGVLGLGDCGVGVPVGDVKRLARAITLLDEDRNRLAALTRGAAAVASRHLFEDVFDQRVRHLERIAFRGDRA